VQTSIEEVHTGLFIVCVIGHFLSQVLDSWNESYHVILSDKQWFRSSLHPFVNRQLFWLDQGSGPTRGGKRFLRYTYMILDFAFNLF